MAEPAAIARPYARALFTLTPDAAQADQMARALDALAALSGGALAACQSSNAQIGKEQLANVLLETLQAQAGAQSSPPTLPAFLRELLGVGTQRLAVLPQIAEQFRALKNARQGQSLAQIETAFPLSDKDLSALMQKLEQRFARKLLPQVTLVSDLIGGVRVRVGDEVLDESVATQIERLRNTLQTAS